LKIFICRKKFCAYWLLTLNYILVYFENAIWLFYELFIHVCSEANVRKKNLHISLFFSASSVKSSDEHVLASGRAQLCRSLIWQHVVRTSMYHVWTRAFAFSAKHILLLFTCFIMSCCVFFSRISPKILEFSAHLFSFPGISFDFPYSLKLWFFLEYWNF